MGCNTGAASIEFPSHLIDAEIMAELENVGVEFKKPLFNENLYRVATSPEPLEIVQEQYADPEAHIDGGIFYLHNSETCYGEFDALEILLVKKDIPFDRETSQDWGIDPGARIFRPGDPPLDLWIDDIPGSVVDVQKLVTQAINALNSEDQSDDFALNLLAEAKEKLDKLNPTYPPLADYIEKEAA